MGYVLIALAVFGRDALAAVIVFFFAYLASNAGAFAAVAALYRDETKPHPIGLLAGEGRRSPFAGRRPGALPLLARRDPGDRGLHRKVLPVQGGDRPGSLRARDHRRRQQPRLDRVLPESGLHPVHARTGRDRGAARAWRRAIGLALGLCGRGGRSRDLSRPTLGARAKRGRHVPVLRPLTDVFASERRSHGPPPPPSRLLPRRI